MENLIVPIKEKDYQKIKKEMGKTSDYFNKNEYDILMQFLMQRHE